MTREEAREFLINISYKLGNMSVEYLSEKDGEKMRDAISVLEQEPRKGHWIVAKGSYLGMRNACCSNCKDFYTNDWNVMNYCPNCGAKMAESEEV